MIHVSELEMETIVGIIKAHAPAHDVLAFGSRYSASDAAPQKLQASDAAPRADRGGPKKYSDLDLAFVCDGGLDPRTRTLLEDAFSESDLPFRVDVIDYRAVSSEFRAIIDGRSGPVYRSTAGAGGGLDGGGGGE
jgi:hypothetical protein